MIAFIISIFVVYTVRRLSVDHAWKIAAASGAVVNIVVIVIGDIVFDIHTSYNMLIIGNIAAVVIGIIMDYCRRRNFYGDCIDTAVPVL